MLVEDLIYHFWKMEPLIWVCLFVLSFFVDLCLLVKDIIVSLIHCFSVLWVWFVSALFYSLFCFCLFYFFMNNILVSSLLKKNMNPYFKKIKSKHIFIFFICLFYSLFCFVFSVYDQYTCVFTVKKEKEKKRRWTPILKRWNPNTFLSDCILLLICLIHFAFLT